MGEARPAAARGAGGGAMAALAAILALSLLHSWQRAFLIDDAFISFRYAENLVRGAGLVFNVGERVEGYTNFLWTLLMAVAAGAGLDPAAVSMALGLGSSAAVLAILYAWGRQLGLAPFWSLLAPAMLALNRSYASWATGGLETRFFTLLIVAAAWRLHVEARQLLEWRDAGLHERRPVVFPVSALILGLAGLTRPEGGMAALIALGGLLWALRRRHHVASRAYLAGWLSLVVLIIGAHLAWRKMYYGMWLPNSFHAKVPGPRVVSGGIYLAEFFRHHLALPLGAVGLALVARLGRAGAAARATLGRLAVFAAPFVVLYAAYTVVVGGDHFEFRFMDPVLPLIYLLAAALASSRPDTGAGGAVARAWGPAATGALVLAMLAGGGLSSAVGFTDIDRTIRWGGREHYVSIVSTETESRYLESWSRIGAWFRDNARAGDSIAVAPSGVIPYLSGLRTLDMLGINDREIASMPVKPGQNVGHERWADVEFVRSRGITYYIGSPVLSSRKMRQVPGDPVEVRLEDGYFYFWVLEPAAAITPGSSFPP